MIGRYGESDPEIAGSWRKDGWWAPLDWTPNLLRDSRIYKFLCRVNMLMKKLARTHLAQADIPGLLVAARCTLVERQ